MPDLNLSSNLVDPLVFDTYCRPQVWGGRRLGELLGRALPTDGPYGESWDLCSQKLHVSRVLDGQYSGRDLAELWSHHQLELAGSERRDPFPILLKWLECRELLSLQVHPNDEMAQRVLQEPFGKSEAWVVVFAEPTARIYSGLKRGVTRDDFVTHLKQGTVSECLNSFVPKPGDCISIPAGTIHAAGGGLVIAEVQQSSDATFRLFDWNRLGLDGKPRPLQIDRAIEAINWDQGPVSPVKPIELPSNCNGVRSELLVSEDGFRMERYHVQTAFSAPYPGELTIWMVLAGNAVLSNPVRGSQRRFGMGSTVVLPAAARDTVWKPDAHESSLTLLCVRLN